MKKNKKRLLKYFYFVLLLVAIVCLIIKFKKEISFITINNVRNYILSYGELSSVVFVVLYSIKPIALIIPSSALSILAGSIFNPHKATLLSIIGCFGSATIAFFISRFFGKSFVDRIIKGKAMTLDSNIEKHGFKIMLLMRLCLVFPYDALSYAAGLSKMRYKDFILATILGVLPEMYAYSFLGENLTKPLSIKFLFPVVLAIILAIGGMYIYKRINKNNNV